MKNNQKPLKQNLALEGMLEINEVFYTIQGEGPLSGRPAVFIRLAGCNLQCTWCDTEYSKILSMSALSLLNIVRGHVPAGIFKEDVLVVITGGEPFRQDIAPLCTLLSDEGFSVQIETNGTLSNPNFPWGLVTLVVSPKTVKLHTDILKHATFYKYVISEKDKYSPDGLPITNTQPDARLLRHIARPPENIDRRNIFLSPMDNYDSESNKKSLLMVIDFVLRFGYTLSLQVHKIINLP